MSTHLPPGSVLLRSQLTQIPQTAGASLGGSIGRPTASYNDFIKDIYNGIKSINNSINQITNTVIRMEQRLDTLETGLATLTTKLDTIGETVEANLQGQQTGDAESQLLTRLDLMDVGCLLEPQLPTFDNLTSLDQTNNNTILDNSPNNQKVTEFNRVNEATEEFDTLILE